MGYLMKLMNPRTKETKEFHDDRYWEVAEDYGRSLYSELAILIRDTEDTTGVKNSIANSLPEWSSHGGRRGQKAHLDWSSHNGRRANMRPIARHPSVEASLSAVSKANGDEAGGGERVIVAEEMDVEVGTEQDVGENQA